MAKAKEKTGGDSNKNLLIYVAAFGALLMIAVYFLVYNKLMEQAETIERSNQELSARVDELKVYYDNRETYLKLTQVTEQLIDEIVLAYPADAREEDAIILAVRMQQESGASFQSVSMEKGSAIHTVAAETVTAANSEKYTQGIQFYTMNATYANEVSYSGLKSMIQMIFDNDSRIGIQNITYSKGDDENPNLTGHMDLIFYSASGTGKEYVAPDIVPYLAGTDNIFGEVEGAQ